MPAIIVVRAPGGLSAADEAEVARISNTLAGPAAPAGVDGVISTATMPRARQGLVSANGTTSMILVPIKGMASNDERFAETDFAVVAVAMAVLIFVVLSLLLRALLAPLVLLATTALSLLAALGATIITWVVIGGQAGTNNRVLLYSLIFLVALGVDYNILLASRIREEMRRWRRTASPAASGSR